MVTSFDTLINSYIDQNVGIDPEFLNSTLTRQLRQHLNELFDAGALKDAGTSNNPQIQSNKLVRSDSIYWLDRKHEHPFENAFLDLIDAFVLYLNATCYTSITSYEFHYARYDKGAFYSRHLDQFRNNDRRQYSMISYLNDHWEEKDGGELCIYQDNQEQLISPMNGKMVFFKSAELEHEVKPCTQARLSITGWLKTSAHTL